MGIQCKGSSLDSALALNRCSQFIAYLNFITSTLTECIVLANRIGSMKVKGRALSGLHVDPELE